MCVLLLPVTNMSAYNWYLEDLSGQVQLYTATGSQPDEPQKMLTSQLLFSFSSNF